jgi:type IV secretion system protein VirD4
MLGSCAVRIYMNPSSHDGTAKRISEELGYTESILDGSRGLMVEPTTLTGPEYADLQIVFGRNTRPMKLRKAFAFQDYFFKMRLGKTVR